MMVIYFNTKITVKYSIAMCYKLINLSFMIWIHNFTERKSVDPAVANDIQPSLPSRPELKPKPILIKKGEKPKTLPKPKIPPKVAPKPNVHFRSQQSVQGGTEV